jgi:hypothetical protein
VREVTGCEPRTAYDGVCSSARASLSALGQRKLRYFFLVYRSDS